MSFKHLAYLFLLSIFAAGCAANMSMDNEVIAVVGGKKITYGDFTQQYAQNTVSSDTTNSVSSKKYFLNLLIDYNLKLLEAKREHLLEQPAVRSEMKNYETQLAVSYVLEHQITDPMVRKIYKRRHFEVRAEQVFIQIRPDSAFPRGDTLKAYKEAVAVIKDLKAGAPIDSLIKVYRGGDTRYITAGTFLQYVGGEQFENMLYTLKPGQVGNVPIRTAFGYLVVKLEDRKPRYAAIRASDILIKIEGKTHADTMKAYDKAVAVLDSAKSGVSFTKLALDNSADSANYKHGGDLGYFTRGMMVAPFEDAAFNIKKIGGLAGPVKTRFGYHIIKLTGIRPVPRFSEVKQALRETYLNGGYKFDFKNFLDSLKNSYDFNINQQAVDMIYRKVDSTKSFESTDFDSLLTPEELRQPIVTFDNDSASVDTVLATVRASGKYNSLEMTHGNIEKIADEAGNELVLNHYSLPQARTYPQFDSLITKYEDGILIYQIEQQQVWDKITKSDSVLKPYFLAHADKYYWPRRADLSRMDFASYNVADSVYELLKKGENFDTLASKLSFSKDLREKSGHWGLFADSSNVLAITAFKMKKGEFSKPEHYDGTFSLIKVDGFVAPEPMTFEEARGQVSADFQEYEANKLRNQWMDKLRKEFGVTIHQKKFDELVSKR